MSYSFDDEKDAPSVSCRLIEHELLFAERYSLDNKDNTQAFVVSCPRAEDKQMTDDEENILMMFVVSCPLKEDLQVFP